VQFRAHRADDITAIAAVCEQWLDNADLTRFELVGSGVQLKFIVGGSVGTTRFVDIQCLHVQSLSLSKSADDEFSNGTFVGNVLWPSTATREAPPASLTRLRRSQTARANSSL
jgi:hypothetical protein